MHICVSNVLEIGCQGEVTLHSVNNTVMQLSDIFLLIYDEEDPIGRMASTKYASEVLVDRNGSIKWCRRKKKQL